MINQEIYSRYISKGHTRRPETPETIVFDDHYFKFDYYTLKGISYICQYGINRHCKNRCNARILVPYSIHSEENWEEKVQLSDNHSNHPIINTAKPPFFSESQISKEIENIYLSNTPRYSRFKTFNLLLEFISKNTPDNEKVAIVSKKFFNKIYNKLEEDHKKSENVKLLKNLRNENFELFTITFSVHGSDEPQTIKCYSSEFQINLVEKAEIVGIDCTFQTAPPKYKQVMVILSRTDKLNIPLAYILLPSKSEKVYKLAFQTLKNFIGDFPFGTTFISDFEQGEINAIKSVLMTNGHFIQLCYFHFVKSIKHFFATDIEDFTKNDDSSNEELLSTKKKINKMVKKCCKIFPFIPHNKVYSAIEILKSFSQTKKFSEYFYNTYLNRYSIDDWSTIGKRQSVIVTNNMVERHNRKLNDLFHHSHPSLGEFETQLAFLENDYFNLYKNSEENESSNLVHFCEKDFDTHFTNLKNFLMNHAKPLNPLPKISTVDDEAESLLLIEDMRHLPKPVLDVLIVGLRNYFSTPERSKQRFTILKNIEAQFHHKKLTVHSIRLWFNNNRDKYMSYIQNEDNYTPITL